VRLIAPFEHDGAAQRLMHLLKYGGPGDLAELAAEFLETRVPRLPLVPVPRAISRRLKYGVDPAEVVARALARRIDVPVTRALTPPLHNSRRAGRDHGRPVPPFRNRGLPYPEVLVVDDVVTTGATMIAAIEALGRDRVRAAVAANTVSVGSRLPLP
jgi:predicted amidophosphoribosyltransferase